MSDVTKEPDKEFTSSVAWGGGAWAEKIVYRFPGDSNPGFAYNEMVFDGEGNFYGATVHGDGENARSICNSLPRS